MFLGYMETAGKTFTKISRVRVGLLDLPWTLYIATIFTNMGLKLIAVKRNFYRLFLSSLGELTVLFRKPHRLLRN